MKKLKGMVQGMRFTSTVAKKDHDASNDFTRVLSEDPPAHSKAPSVAENSEGHASASSIAAPVRHICTKCGTTVLFPPPMQRRTCSGCGTPMCLSQDPTNPVVEDCEPLDVAAMEESVIQKLKSFGRSRSSASRPSVGASRNSVGAATGGGGGFGDIVSRVLSNQSQVSVRPSASEKRQSLVKKVFSGRTSVFSTPGKVDEVGPPVSALPEKPDFEDLLCVLLNLAAMVCSADLSDCNTVVQTFLWADAAALRTVTAKVTSGLETQQRQWREGRSKSFKTFSEEGAAFRLGEIVKHFIESSGEHPDAARNNERLKGLTLQGTPKKLSPTNTPERRSPATTKGSQEFAALYRSLSSGSRITGVSRRPSLNQKEPCINEDNVLDEVNDDKAGEAARVDSPESHDSVNGPLDSQTGPSPTQQLIKSLRAGSTDTLGLAEKSMSLNPDGGLPQERRISSATDISANSFSEFHQKRKTFSFASKTHMQQIESAKGAMSALLSRTKSFGLTWSPRSSQEQPSDSQEDQPDQTQQTPSQPAKPSQQKSLLKKSQSRTKTLARGVSTHSVQSSTSKVSEVIRGLLRRQASKNNCVAIGEINWGMDGSARDEATDRRVKQSQALARRYQRKEPLRRSLPQEEPPLPSVPSASSQSTPSAPSAAPPAPPAPPAPSASSEDKHDFNGRGSFDTKEAKRFSDTVKKNFVFGGKRLSSGGTVTFGSEGEDDDGIVSKKSLFTFLVHELHIQRIPMESQSHEQPQQRHAEKKLSRLGSQLSQLMLSRSMTGATDCTVPTAVLLDLALRDLGDDPVSPMKESPTLEEVVAHVQTAVHASFESTHTTHLAPARLDGGFRINKALICESGELTDIAETSTAASGITEQESALSDQERWRRRKEQKRKQKQDPTKNTYGAILRNSYEQNIDGVCSDATTSIGSSAGQAARNQVEQDRERLAAISGGCRSSASTAPAPSMHKGTQEDDESIIALGASTQLHPDPTEYAEVRSGVTSDNNSVFSGEVGACGAELAQQTSTPRPCDAEPAQQSEDAAMSRWKARKAAKAQKRRCQTKMTYGAILKMEHEQEMEFEGATAPKPPLGQPSGLFGPPPPCGAPPPPLFGSAAHDPSLLKATASSKSQSPTFGGHSEGDSDDDANAEEEAGGESISLRQYRPHAEDAEARLRSDDDEEERRWDAIRRAQAAEEAMENDDQSSFAPRNEVYVDADAEVAAIAAAMRSVSNGRHGTDIEASQASPKGSIRSGSEPLSPNDSVRSGSEPRSHGSRESTGGFRGILRRSTGGFSDEDLNTQDRHGKRDSCTSQKTVDFDFDSNETYRWEKQNS